MKRARLFDVPLDLYTMDELVDACEALIERRVFAQQTSMNASKVVLMHDDPELRDAVASSAIVTADGQSVVLAGRLHGIAVPERVAGIDLMERLLERAESRLWPVFFLGARPEVLETFLAVVSARYPKIPVAGSADGFFANSAEVARQISISEARILFIAMPSPAKEFFVRENARNLGSLLAVGVGGSFDVWAGLTTRAPRWMQRSGLEWFHRFLQEPGRMWKRYLVGNSRFAWLTLLEFRRSRARNSSGSVGE